MKLRERFRAPELFGRFLGRRPFEAPPVEDAGSALYLDYFHATRLDELHPLHPGNRIRLYHSGRATFASLERSIGAARSSVNMEIYIFKSDETGTRIRDILAERQSRGVQVNLLIDALGSLETPDSFFEPLASAGGRVERFNPIIGWRRRFRNPNNRDHRKIVVVDGETAYMGGMNVGDDYSADFDEDPSAWRDTFARIRGPVVSAIQELFLDHFEWETGKRLDDRPYVADLDPEPGGATFCRVVGGEPGTRISRIRRAYGFALRRSRAYAYFTTGYFVPPRHFLRALKRAARRGVDVRLLLPGKTDHRFVRWAGHSFYGQLLRSGVRIFEWVVSPLHAKTAVVDGAWGVVGSANLDVRSFEVNYEADLHVLGRETGRFLRATFLRDIGRAKEIHLEAWNRRGIVARLVEKFCALFRRWL